MKVFESLFLFFTFIFTAMFAHPNLTYEFSTPKYFFLIVFMVILISVYILRKTMKNELKIYFSAAQFGWLLFGIAAIVSTLSVMKSNPIYFPFSFEIGVYTLFTFFIVTYLSNTLDTKKSVNYFLIAVIFSGFMVSIEALLNFYTGDSFFLGSYGTGGKMSMKATIGNPNFVSDFLGSLLPITVYFALSSDFSWLKGKEENKNWFLASVISVKSIALINFFLFFFVVLLAGTRAVFLSLIAGVIVFIVAYLFFRKFSSVAHSKKVTVVNENKKVLSINRICLIIVLAIGILLPVILSNPENPLAEGVNVTARTASIFDERGFQTTGGKARVLAWKASENQWKDNPLIGGGIGTYMLYAVDYMADAMHESPEYIDSWSNFKRTHNDYFQVLGEMGILGFAAMVFTLIIMVIMFFRMLKNMDNKDDALLLILLAVSFTEILGHSFTEFPLHLLPNQLWAMAIGGIGFGSYMNRNRIFAKKINVKFSIAMVLLALTLTTGITAGVFKYKSMMAESKFKEGNGYYSALAQIESAVNRLNQQKTQIEDAYKSLDAREGIYQQYREDVYLPARMEEIKNSGVTGIAESQIKLKASNDLQNQLQSEYSKLNGYLDQIDQKLNEAAIQNEDYYLGAKDCFLDSMANSNCYGKSLFYLSLMMARPERKQELISQISNSDDAFETLAIQFSSTERDTAYIMPEFRNYPLKNDIELFRIISDKYGYDNAVKLVQLSLWYDIKMHQDGIDYFRTSLKCFNEKNTYRIMGKFYFNLAMMMNSLVEVYESLISNNDIQLDSHTIDLIRNLISQHKANSEAAFEDFKWSYDTAIYILPGNWQLFPDWENIYAEYIDLILKSSTVTEVYPKIKEISEKRIWASEAMHDVERLGVPDDIVSVYSQIAQAFLNEKFYQETLTVIDDGLAILYDSYNWNAADLSDNEYLTDSEKNRINNFLKSYESLENKRKQFVNQMISLYTAAQSDENMQNQFIEDWKVNMLTGEVDENPSLGAIIDNLKMVDTN